MKGQKEICNRINSHTCEETEALTPVPGDNRYSDSEMGTLYFVTCYCLTLPLHSFRSSFRVSVPPYIVSVLPFIVTVPPCIVSVPLPHI